MSLPNGGHHDLVLELSDRPLDGPPPEPDDAWAATERSWSDVVPDCDDTNRKSVTPTASVARTVATVVPTAWFSE